MRIADAKYNTKEVLIFATSLLFFLTYLASWNWSYSPTTEGWFFVAGQLVVRGELPYIDFYGYLPPFYYWLVGFITWLIGYSPEGFRLFGFLLSGSSFFVVYLLLRRWNNSAVVAAFASLVTMSLATSGNAFFSYDFLYVMRFFSLLGFLILFNQAPVAIGWGAVFLSLGALTKHSDGTMLWLTGLAFVFFANSEPYKKLAIYFVTTLITTCLIFLPYIIKLEIQVVFDALLIQASNNKGGGVSPLFLWFQHGFFSLENLYFIIKSTVPIFVFFGLINISDRIWPASCHLSWSSLARSFAWIVLGTLFIFHFGNVDFTSIKGLFFNHFNNLSYLAGGYIPFLLLGFAFLPSSVVKSEKFLEAGLLSIGFILGAGTSGGLTFVSIAFSIGTIIVFLDKVFGKSVVFRLGVAIYFLSVCATLFSEKLNKPFAWWYVESSPIRFQNMFSTDTNVKAQLDLFREEIKKCERQPNNLLAFPHMTQFNIAADLFPYGKAIVFWMDYLSDAHALEQLTQLRYRKPDIIVFWDMPDDVYNTHSNLFKAGEPMVHKDIAEVITAPEYLDDYETIAQFAEGANDYMVYAKAELNCPMVGSLR